MWICNGETGAFSYMVSEIFEDVNYVHKHILSAMNILILASFYYMQWYILSEAQFGINRYC